MEEEEEEVPMEEAMEEPFADAEEDLPEETFEEPTDAPEEEGEAAEFAEELPEEAVEGDPDLFEELGEGEPDQSQEVPKWVKDAFVPRREGRLALCLRQSLKTDADAQHFCTELSRRIEEAAEKAEMLVFEDFDISQNPIPMEHIESMFNSLSSQSIHIERLRAFGIATFDDTAAILLSGWLQGVSADNAPHELHLSDCALTAVGFRAIMDALVDNSVFPAPDPRHPSRGQLPLYMRVEGNYIEESALQSAVDDGTAITMTKNGGMGHSDTAKCRLLVRGEDHSFAQKEGDPPAPEDAAPPKRVRDYGKGGKGGSKGKSKDRSPWSKGGKGKGSSQTGKGSASSSQGSTAQRPWKSDWSSKAKNDSYGNRNDQWPARRVTYKDKDDSWSSKSWKEWNDNSRPPPSKQSSSSKWKSWEEKDKEKDKWSQWKDKRDNGWESKKSSQDWSRGQQNDRKESSWDKWESKKNSWSQQDEKEKWKREESGGKGGKGSKGKGKTKSASARPALPAPTLLQDITSKKSTISEEERNQRFSGSSGKGSWGKSQAKGKRSGQPPMTAFRESEQGGRKRDARDTYESSGGPAKRARTAAPANGSSGKSSGKGKGKGKAKSVSLPEGWEMHWSDQYDCPFYWHSTTGESRWEKPKA